MKDGLLVPQLFTKEPLQARPVWSWQPVDARKVEVSAAPGSVDAEGVEYIAMGQVGVPVPLVWCMYCIVKVKASSKQKL